MAAERWQGIWDNVRSRWVCVGDFGVGILADEVFHAVAAFQSANAAKKAIVQLAKILRRDANEFTQKLLKKGMTAERLLKHKEERRLKLSKRAYCGHCGRKLKRNSQGVLCDAFVGSVIVDGARASVPFCNEACHRKLVRHTERSEQCHEEELRSLQQGRILLRAMGAYTRMMMRHEASRSQSQESAPATNSRN